MPISYVKQDQIFKTESLETEAKIMASALTSLSESAPVICS